MKKNVIIGLLSILLILIISIALWNNRLFFTLVRFDIAFDDDASKNYQFFDSNKLYIEYKEQAFRHMIVDDKNIINDIYGGILKLEEYNGADPYGEIIYMFQLMEPLEGNCRVLKGNDVILLDMKDKNYIMSESLLETLKDLRESKTFEYVYIEE
ncbi:MAG TPA: hypothetical protein VJ990_02420 [Clostridia bacterium]|nr:hypothetical protein [Clostridia bacterium]